MPKPFDVELQLQRHGGALRQLARELVQGRGDADDVVQETWRRALRSPPRHADRLGGWLATVLRSVAHRWRRSEARRLRHEQDASRPEAVADDPATLAARAEVARQLLAAVEALDVPYRQAIWLRYFEGLAPREIAAASGVPVATVKSRLQRGLAMLREGLGQRDGDDWRAAFAAALGLAREGTVTAASLAAAGVVMATWMKVVALSAAAIAIAIWAWWPDVTPVTRATALAPAPPVSAVLAGEAISVERTPVAADVSASTSAAANPDASPVRRRGRVIDAATSAPLQGVVVTWGGSRTPGPADPCCVTDDGGRFDLVSAADGHGEVWFTKEGWLSVRSQQSPLAAGQQDDIGDIPVPRGRALHGRLVDDRGVPLAAGIVLRARFAQSWGPTWVQYPWLDAIVGADGEFRLVPGVALGTVDFELPGGEHELTVRVQVAEHEPASLTLVATRRPEVRGVVVDDDGAPVAGVGLGNLTLEPLQLTAADGSFCLLRPNRLANPAVELRVMHAPAFVPVPPRQVAWGTTDLRIVLSRTGKVPIEVVDDAGTAVEQFGVVLQREGMTGVARGSVLQRGTHQGGRLAVDCVVPGQTSLRVVPVDPGLTPSDVIPIVTADALRVVLGRRVPCTIEVARGGRAVVDAQVQIVFLGEAAKGDSLPPLLDPRSGPRAWLPREGPELVAQGRTDGQGMVRLVRDRETGCRAVQVSCSGRKPFVARDVTFPADSSVLRIELPGFGEIAGRVHLRDRNRGRVTIALQQGETTRNLTPQPDGTFASPPLLAGTWRVGIATIDGLADARDVEVRDGERADVQLDVWACPAPGSVRGRVVRNGPLPAGLTVELMRLHAGPRPSPSCKGKVTADGTFIVDEVPGGTYRIAVRAGSQAMPALLADTFVLAVGEQLRLDVPLPARRLVVRLHRTDGSPVRGEKVLTRCDGAQWPSIGWLAASVDEVMVLDPAPMLPVEFAACGNHLPVWSAPVVMPPDRAEAEVMVVLPDPKR